MSKTTPQWLAEEVQVGRDAAAQRQAADARFQADASNRGFRFLLAYIVVQVCYLGVYFSAAQNNALNYIPLLADSIMLLLHLCGALFRASGQLKHYRCFMAVALLADAILFAFADPIVESEASVLLDAGEFLTLFGGLPKQRRQSLPHPYKSNLVFQFHCLYMTLLVLPFRSAALVMPVCMAIYSIVIGSSYYSNYDRVQDLSGVDASVDREEVLIETVLMWCTLLLGLFAKRSLEQAQRPLFLALETDRDEILREKAKRCNAEYQASGLRDKMQRVLQLNAPARGPESVVSAPAGATATSRRVRKQKQTDSDATCESGDCLPSDACVWIENQAAPQRLGTVKTGQRVLCYDNLMCGLKYTDILGVSLAEGSETSEWVTIVLQDGTKLEMTPNHPLECFSATGAEGSPTSRCIQAGNIRADMDSVMVLKTVMVPVSDVQRQAAGSDNKGCTSQREWVDLRVQHPDRHTVFVAQNHRFGQSGGMAVGTPDFSHVDHGISIKRTFVTVEEADSSISEVLSSRQTASAPDLDWAHDPEIGMAGGNSFALDNISSGTDSSPRRPTVSKPVMDRVASLLIGATEAFSRLSSGSQPEAPTQVSDKSQASYAGTGSGSDTAGPGAQGAHTAASSSGASTASAADTKRAGGRRRDRQREKRRSADPVGGKHGAGPVASQSGEVPVLRSV